jgi:hypothetical protein
MVLDPSWKVTSYLCIYVTRNFITIFMKDRHLFLSWARLSSPYPHLITLTSILILSSIHVYVFPVASFFFLAFLQECLLSVRARFLVHHIFLDFTIIIRFGEECKLKRSSLCNFIKYPIISISSEPCSQTPLVYLLPLSSENKSAG